jgi:hypothetical protein
VSTPVQVPDETAKLAEVASEVSAVVARAREIEVSTDAQAQEATGFLAEIKAAKARGERARKFLVEPLNNHVRAINARFKETAGPLDEADQLVRGKLQRFILEQARTREREQARLDEERRVAEERAAAERKRAWEEAQRAEREAEEAAADTTIPREVLATLHDGQLRAFVDAGGRRGDCARLEMEARQARRIAEEATQADIAAQSAPAVQVAPAAPLATDAGKASVRQTWKAVIVDESRLPREFLMPNKPEINAAVRRGVRDIPGVRIEQVTGLAVRANG